MSLISLVLKTTSHGCPKDQRPIVEFNPKLHFVIPLIRYNLLRAVIFPNNIFSFSGKKGII